MGDAEELNKISDKSKTLHIPTLFFEGRHLRAFTNRKVVEQCVKSAGQCFSVSAILIQVDPKGLAVLINDVGMEDEIRELLK